MITKKSVLSLFLSEENAVRRLLGDGKAGYKDGDPGSAQFKKPRSFAVDLKGNVYVNDKGNGVIRKITNSGLLSNCFLLIVSTFFIL